MNCPKEKQKRKTFNLLEIMKYPAAQLQILQDSIATLANHFNVQDIHPATLHSAVYYQSSEGHKHNWLYKHVSGEGISRRHAIEDLNDWNKLFEVPASFMLYPDGCNDSHVETAVKHCLKQIKG